MKKRKVLNTKLDVIFSKKGGPMKSNFKSFLFPIFETGDRKSENSFDLKAFILGLSLLEGAGWNTVRCVISHYLKSGEAIFNRQKLINILHEAKIPDYKRIAEKIISCKDGLIEKGSKEYEKLKNEGINLLVGEELPDFVSDFNGEKPLWLFVKGNKSLLYSKKYLRVGIVGTRNPSVEAEDYVKKLVWLLAHYPIIIVSGLANGIDSLAHKISIDKGLKNVAFLGHGLRISISKESKNLMDLIVNKGGVVASEYFLNERYNKETFLRRNRWIASMSEILIPVQANVPGGTYSTVLHALKKQKPVIGIKMENSEIVKFLLEKGCSVIDINKKEDMKLLDKFIKEKFKEKGIEVDDTAFVEKKVRKAINAEFSYRFTDEKFCERLINFLKETIEQIKEGEKGEKLHVDKGNNNSS